MDTKIMSAENVREILSRAIYWNEVIQRENAPIDTILRNELNEVAQSLGTKILWVLEEYAKGCKGE